MWHFRFGPSFFFVSEPSSFSLEGCSIGGAKAATIVLYPLWDLYVFKFLFV